MNRDRNVALVARLPLLLILANCGSDELGGATLSFQSSGCKSEQGDALPKASTSTNATLAESAYDGLTCVAWETGKDRTTFRVYNLDGACGADYAGRAFVADGGKAVTLSLTNPSGSIAACGWCVYDLTYEVAGTAVDANLAVTVERSNSAERAGTDVSKSKFVLAAADNPSGVACAYGNPFAMQDHARKVGKSGARNFPCDTTAAALPTGCREGLACTVTTPASQGVCLSPCAGSADCGDATLYACTANTCQLKAPSPL
jgi:hypothetical protein